MNTENTEGDRRMFVVAGARYATWQRDVVSIIDGAGHHTGVTLSPDHPAVIAFVDAGGVIQARGPRDKELAWLKAHKIVEIEAYADDRLERNESNWSRSARLARIALVDVCPQAGPITLREIEQTHYDAETLAGAKNYIDHVQAMDSIDAVRAFAPEMMAWPKFT